MIENVAASFTISILEDGNLVVAPGEPRHPSLEEMVGACRRIISELAERTQTLPPADAQNRLRQVLAERSGPVEQP